MESRKHLSRKTIEDYPLGRPPLPPFQLFDWSFSYCHIFSLTGWTDFTILTAALLLYLVKCIECLSSARIHGQMQFTVFLSRAQACRYPATIHVFRWWGLGKHCSGLPFVPPRNPSGSSKWLPVFLRFPFDKEALSLAPLPKIRLSKL